MKTFRFLQKAKQKTLQKNQLQSFFWKDLKDRAT